MRLHVMRRGVKRLSIVASGVLILALAGAVYETTSRRAGRTAFPPAGTMVDFGGRRLHLLCIGTGTPTVIFESSGFGTALSFVEARTKIAARVRVCSYDRAGAGWSDPPSGRVSAGLLADDLRRLQDSAALTPPFVLVASSIGGIVVEMFARRHPDQVAGLLFLDAANSDLLPLIVPAVTSWQVRGGCGVLSMSGRLGLVRLLDPFGLRRSNSADARQSFALTYGAQPWKVLCALVRNATMSEREFGEAPPLRGELPLTVLTADGIKGLAPPGLERWVQPSAPLLAEAQRRFSERSANGIWRLVRGSDHLIASSNPQAVVDAVFEIIRRAE